jgi:uncharacterized protein (DUF433 family)
MPRHIAATHRGNEGVERSPDIWSGAAVVVGSAIPVFLIENIFNETERVGDVLEVYPWLTKAEVLRALAYAADDAYLVRADRQRHEDAIRSASNKS